MDELVTTVKSMKITAPSTRRPPAPAIRVVEAESKQVDWENVKNIVDLTELPEFDFTLALWQKKANLFYVVKPVTVF